jgi:TolB-like protein
MRIIEELKRRNVFRVAGVYAVVAWLLIQIVVAVKAPLHLPGWTDTLVIVLFAVGFPVALILAWAFEMTPDGVKLTANVSEGQSIAAKTGRKLDYAILAGLALVALMIVADRVTPDRKERIAAEGGATSPGGRAATEISAASIAVLPFPDLSPAKDQEYFSDGMAEEILNVLAKVDGLNVAARTSSFAFKGQETLGIPAIAKEPGVRHVLEGSVRKSGDAIRITAQLIDSTSDAHLWSETYDRKLTAENIFSLQDDIAGAIVAALRDKLGLKVGAAAAASPEGAKSTADLSAYDLYLQARALFQRREHLEEADALLGEAVGRDPGFVDAWALRAAIASLLKEYVVTDRTYEEFGGLVEDYADRALALNPDNARAIAARANFRMTAAWNRALVYDLGPIVADFDRAISIDPRDSSMLNWFGVFNAWIGNSEEALKIFADCEAFDPYFGPCSENHYDLLVVLGRYDDALAHYEKVLDKGIVVSGWMNFSLLAHFDMKVAFMQATNHPSWMPDWRRHEDLYDAFRRPDEDHGELIAELRNFARATPGRGVNPYSALVVPIGVFEASPYPILLWGADYARYRRSPEFKAYIRDSGVDAYWREHGFPPQGKPRGPQNSENADFECE